MYKVYLKQAWALMGQNRFFTAVYIIGTGLAISMVMAIAVVYHIRNGEYRPGGEQGPDGLRIERIV